jgi:hypothetical protein
MIVDCSLTHLLLDAKLSTVRLHLVERTWQLTLALALAGSRRCRELSLQGVVTVAGSRRYRESSLLQGRYRCRGFLSLQKVVDAGRGLVVAGHQRCKGVKADC